MKKRIGGAAMAAALFLVFAVCEPIRAADAVQPASVTVTNARAEAAQTVTWAGTLYWGQTLVFTNCQLLTVGNATQGLDEVTVTVSVGSAQTNIDYTAAVSSTNQGRWGCAVVVPSSTAWQMQVKVTDVNTNTFIYPVKTFLSDTSFF